MDALKTKGQMYDQIDLGKIQKSGFDLSHNVKGTGRIGRIIPTRCQEVLPGDRMKGSSAAAVQFEPLAVPMLANMYVRQEHFYVPNRIVWKNWDKFFTGGEKLDFTTPPPSFDSVAGVLVALGINQHDYDYVVTSIVNETDVVIPSASVSDFRSLYLPRLRQFWLDKGESTDTLDLLQPCIEAIDTFMADFDSQRSNWLDSTGALPIFSQDQAYYEPFIKAYGDVGSSDYLTLSSYLVSKSPDPYESAIAMALQGVSYWDTEFSPMTEFGRAYVHMWYDMLKCFVGTSSNLDYLNYERCTLSDFYYSFYVRMQHRVQSDLGLDYSTFSTRSMNVLALRANYAIWYNYYRDQLLETNCPEPSQEDTVTSAELFHLVVPRQRCWSKDTFTTALATTGTGNVVVPITTATSTSNRLTSVQSWNVAGADSSSVNFGGLDVYEVQTSNGDTIEIPTRFIKGMQEDGWSTSPNQSYFSLDLLDACRRAQKWLQKALIYGNRPQDRLYTSWGVRSLDARLSLPECLATSSQMVQLSVNTNNTTIQAPTGETMSVAGDKSANAYGYDKGGDFNRFCEEHGLIISYLTILPEATYSLHKSRAHSRMDKFDYPTPEFATLGMDAVYRSELMVTPTRVYDGDTYHSIDDVVFGYQGRYFDSKCNQDEEHGELQTSQSMYTFARTWNVYDSAAYPALSYEFVHCFPPLDMFVVDSSLADYFRYDIHHALAAERALPVCGMYL